MNAYTKFAALLILLALPVVSGCYTRVATERSDYWGYTGHHRRPMLVETDTTVIVHHDAVPVASNLNTADTVYVDEAGNPVSNESEYSTTTINNYYSGTYSDPWDYNHYYHRPSVSISLGIGWGLPYYWPVNYYAWHDPWYDPWYGWDPYGSFYCGPTWVRPYPYSGYFGPGYRYGDPYYYGHLYPGIYYAGDYDHHSRGTVRSSRIPGGERRLGNGAAPAIGGNQVVNSAGISSNVGQAGISRSGGTPTVGGADVRRNGPIERGGFQPGPNDNSTASSTTVPQRGGVTGGVAQRGSMDGKQSTSGGASGMSGQTSRPTIYINRATGNVVANPNASNGASSAPTMRSSNGGTGVGNGRQVVVVRRDGSSSSTYNQTYHTQNSNYRRGAQARDDMLRYYSPQVRYGRGRSSEGASSRGAVRTEGSRNGDSGAQRTPATRSEGTRSEPTRSEPRNDNGAKHEGGRSRN